ncbi:hypothetical protein ACOMHN_022976 [Nucella lapillus]
MSLCLNASADRGSTQTLTSVVAFLTVGTQEIVLPHDVSQLLFADAGVAPDQRTTPPAPPFLWDSEVRAWTMPGFFPPTGLSRGAEKMRRYREGLKQNPQRLKHYQDKQQQYNKKYFNKMKHRSLE